MTIREVVHKLTVMTVALLVDLPENNGSVFGRAQAVTGCGGLHLGLGEIARRDE